MRRETSAERHYSVSPRMSTIASRDQFKPIRIGENLVVNYNAEEGLPVDCNIYINRLLHRKRAVRIFIHES